MARYEKIDQTKLAQPVSFDTPSHQDNMRRMITEVLSLKAQENGYETFQEADDFNVDDDFDPQSPWEMVFDPGLKRDITRAEHQELNRFRSELDAKPKSWWQRFRKKDSKSEGDSTAPRNTKQKKSASESPPRDSDEQGDGGM